MLAGGSPLAWQEEESVMFVHVSRHLFRSCLLVGVVIGSVGALIGGVQGVPTVRAATPCSDASLRGAFGVRFEGTSKTLGKIASVSLWTFDSRGGFTANETYNSDVTGPKTRNIAGLYRMAADCTFSLLFPSDVSKVHEAVGACVLVDNGREFYCLDVEEGWVATTTGKSIAPTGTVTSTVTPTALVPELPSLVLFGSGLLLLGVFARRTHQRR